MGRDGKAWDGRDGKRGIEREEWEGEGMDGMGRRDEKGGMEGMGLEGRMDGRDGLRGMG